jgi:hypothetical protein
MSADEELGQAGEESLATLGGDLSLAAKLLFGAGGVQDTMAEVVRLAVATVEGCDYAGLFLRESGLVTTAARTDVLVEAVDALQHRAGGPCLDAITERAMFYAEDLEGETRWADFGPMAMAVGLRSILALPLTAHGADAALNLYARCPNAFGSIDRAKCAELASLASLAISTAHVHEDTERRADNLHAALNSREVIGQAQGILMEREGITANEAFDILRRASQNLNVKLREVAQNLVETGEQPDIGTHL